MDNIFEVNVQDYGRVLLSPTIARKVWHTAINKARRGYICITFSFPGANDVHKFYSRKSFKALPKTQLDKHRQ